MAKGNIDRFPPDFMFPLMREEIRNISQIVIRSEIKHARNVNVFTEQGVAMLSRVLNSARAIEVNIAIMRVFVKLRETTAAHQELKRKLKKIENHLTGHDEDIQVIFKTIRVVYPDAVINNRMPCFPFYDFHPNRYFQQTLKNIK